MEAASRLVLLLFALALVRLCCHGDKPLLKLGFCEPQVRSRSFRIANDTFWKDGEPFIIRAGSLHYFRIPRQYWRDRIQRMKALGLNSITTYAPWNYHEKEEGKVEGLDELSDFLALATEESMLVNMRMGPYMCGEWEFGGLPMYLLQKPGMQLRTFNQPYLQAVDRWWGALLPVVKKHLYATGGSIVLTQIENEFGSFGNCEDNPDDAKYMNYLLDMAESHLGTDVLYMTVDGGEDKAAALLSHGTPWRHDPRVLATVDGPLAPGGYDEAFARQKDFNAKGHSPKMWTELWVGWFTQWGSAYAANKSASDAHKGMQAMVNTGASFSLYMAHGGTNWGFYSGANGDPSAEGGQAYQPDVTSYDYNAPISEAGDHNIGSDGGDIFDAVSSAIASKYGPLPKEPAPIKKASYGVIKLAGMALLFENLVSLASCNYEVNNLYDLPCMEALDQKFGLLLYRLAGAFEATTLKFTAKTLHDRVQVFVDGAEVGSAYRAACPANVSAPSGTTMYLLLENMGRINYGPGLYDYKGLHMKPPLPGNWTAHCLPLDIEGIRNLAWNDAESVAAPLKEPVFRRGYLEVASGAVADTFLDTRGLSKGHAWINGHHLGRYWETAGPQHTLYIPASFLVEGSNEVIILDLHGSSVNSIAFVDQPRYPQQHWARKKASKLKDDSEPVLVTV